MFGKGTSVYQCDCLIDCKAPIELPEAVLARVIEEDLYVIAKDCKRGVDDYLFVVEETEEYYLCREIKIEGNGQG